MRIRDFAIAASSTLGILLPPPSHSTPHSAEPRLEVQARSEFTCVAGEVVEGQWDFIVHRPSGIPNFRMVLENGTSRYFTAGPALTTENHQHQTIANIIAEATSWALELAREECRKRTGQADLRKGPSAG